MSVSIRLAKIGKRNAPSYRVVVTQTKSKRNGRFLDIIGFYNPIDTKTKFTIDKEKYTEWAGKGAIVSAAVKELLEGKYTYTKYDPKTAKAAQDNAGATASE